MTAAERNRHREMILNPLRWPNIVLPLKRGNPFDAGNTAVFAPNLGVNTISDDAPIEILIGTLFDKLTTYFVVVEWSALLFTVAAASGDKAAASNRTRVAQSLSPDQIERANELTKVWKPGTTLPTNGGVANK